MIRNIIYILIIIGLFLVTGFGFQENEKVIFHKINFTASSVELVQWNITDTTNTAFVQETIDNLGRTKELRFYNYRHQLDWAGSGFYGGPIIKYDYLKNQIIETFFSSENEIANDFWTSEVPFRFIYHLNDKSQIIDSEIKYKIEFEWTKESLDKTIKHLEFYKAYTIEDWKLDEIFGYNYAYGKLNGINPELKK